MLAFGCNDKGGSAETKTTDSSSVTTSAIDEKLDFPYTQDRPYQDWQPGDKKHAVTVIK